MDTSDLMFKRSSFVLFLLFTTQCGAAIPLDVDLSDISRHLIRCRMTIPCDSGKFHVRFPEWIPGIHGPSGQIRNLAGFRISAGNKPLEWSRDDSHLCRFSVDVPDGTQKIDVELTYLANQPTTVSKGVDSYGTRDLGIVNFNTCLVYPESCSAKKQQYKLRLKLPSGWQYGTALKATRKDGQWQEFEACSLATLIDSPLVTGLHYRKLPIRIPNNPEVDMHFVADSQIALGFDEALAKKYEYLFTESFHLFGSSPFERYDFLVVLSDETPGMGLEHLASSLNGVPERSLIDEDQIKGRAAYLLPHELVHAWCGKYRRPAGMFRDDFHRSKDTRLLWIYEGMTQYYGFVLASRSTLIDFDAQQQQLAARVGYLANRVGRDWRPLEDTAISAYVLRGGSESWNDLRRNQDYYDEGALFWMEVDAMLRERTAGKKSLDDFSRSFFAATGDQIGQVRPFSMPEVIQELNQIVEFDWEGLIDRRIRRVQNQLPLDGIAKAGYRYDFVAEKSAGQKKREKERKYISAEYSLGFTISTKDDSIGGIVPNSVADKAGLADGMELAAVNTKRFNQKRFEDALDATRETGEIELLVVEGDTFKSIVLKYDGGPKYPALIRIDGKTDYLTEIFAPKVVEPIKSANSDE